MQNNNKEEKYIDVRVTYDFRVDISDFDPEHVDIAGLAIDLTKREIDTLNSEDFNYRILKRSDAEDYIRLISEGGSSENPYINIDGYLITKTPELSAHDYDRFCLWRSANFDKNCIVIDSSELQSYNEPLFRKACKYIFKTDTMTLTGQGISEIERFLDLYFGAISYKFKLIGIEQGCKDKNVYYWFYIKLEPIEGFEIEGGKFINKIMSSNSKTSGYNKIAIEELYGDILYL